MKFDEFIDYEELKHAEEFQRLDIKTREVAGVASYLALVLFKVKLETTSIFRKKTNDSGVHEAFRAIDFKMLPHIQDTYFLISKINDIYIYDSRVIDSPSLFTPEELKKRSAMKVAHEKPFHGTGAHIHIQTHPFTTIMTKAMISKFIAQASNDLHNFQAKPLGETKET